MAVDVGIDAATSASASDMMKGSTLYARRRKAMRNCILVANKLYIEMSTAG